MIIRRTKKASVFIINGEFKTRLASCSRTGRDLKHLHNHTHRCSYLFVTPFPDDLPVCLPALCLYLRMRIPCVCPRSVSVSVRMSKLPALSVLQVYSCSLNVIILFLFNCFYVFTFPFLSLSF